MPVTTSAAKALRRDKKRTKVNKPISAKLLTFLKRAEKNSSAENLAQAFSRIDRAAKKGVIHKNKASRLKSKLQKKSRKK